MATVGERLLELKKEIEAAKLDKASAEGALKQDMSRLKDEFQCRTVEAAKQKLEAMKEEKDKLYKKTEEVVSDLEAKYEW